ncbi:MAG: hypothetical protein AAF670_13800 [Planctomycetota bacterium]
MRLILLGFVLLSGIVAAQETPYEVAPDVQPPYYRVRYVGSTQPNELRFSVRYTIWIPPGVERLRGLVVHQHGCGEGSCKSGLTGAFDLHWQALAKKHDCALLAAAYEQPQSEDCQLWCDPRNGSDRAFQQSLSDLGTASGHPELATVPWALWGHSGGGVWAGLMTIMHPNRVAATWLRSGVPLLEPVENRPSAKPISLPREPIGVPMMLNLGTKEGVSVTEGRFAGVWPKVRALFVAMRDQGTPIGVAVDPRTGHECGNQRYLAIRWFDECLAVRLPDTPDGKMSTITGQDVWLAPLRSDSAVPEAEFTGDIAMSVWLPSENIAIAWSQYVRDTNVEDSTPPPAPTEVVTTDGQVTWNATADLESGISHFVILRDGRPVGTVPTQQANRFGRPVFQGLQYSDTPLQPLVQMEFTDQRKTITEPDDNQYEVVSVNTVGLESPPMPAEARITRDDS